MGSSVVNSMQGPYLTPIQVAERLQLNVETVYRWLRSGKLPGIRLSRKVWRITEMDLIELLTTRHDNNA